MRLKYLRYQSPYSHLRYVASKLKTGNTMTTFSRDSKEKLTAEETKQIEQAFQDEAFRKLFAEYVSEISDPKHHEEQEDYIRKLEEHNELPEGKVLIRPKSGFVIKCFQNKVREKANHKGKLFLNAVHSYEIQKPIFNTGKVDDPNGRKWSIPYALGPLRMEVDKSHSLVPTFDCCFHPLSLQYAHRSKPFCNLIVDIAKDAVQKSYEALGEMLTIANGYTILKGVSYKNGSNPKAMMIAFEPQHDVSSNSRSQDIQTIQSKEICDASCTNLLGNKKVCDNENKFIIDTQSVIVPKHEIVERGNFEIADHATMTTKPISRRPNDLIVRILLERIASITDIVLDVSEKNIIVKSIKNTTPQYQLNVALPYSVNTKNGIAKFDKKSRKLIITLPVIEA